MKPIGWSLLLLGVLLLGAALALELGLVFPGHALTASPAMIGAGGLLLLFGGYAATKLSRR